MCTSFVHKGKYAVMTNFSLLEQPADLTEDAGHYGKDRCDTAARMLRAAGDGLSAADALKLLQATRKPATGRPVSPLCIPAAKEPYVTAARATSAAFVFIGSECSGC